MEALSAGVDFIFLRDDEIHFLLFPLTYVLLEVGQYSV